MPGKVNKPLISLQLVNNDGKLEEFDALLDPGSYSEAPYSLEVEVEADIVSYIAFHITYYFLNITEEGN